MTQISVRLTSGVFWAGVMKLSDMMDEAALKWKTNLCSLQNRSRQSQSRRGRAGGSGLQQRVRHRQTGGQGALAFILPAGSVNASSALILPVELDHQVRLS